MKKIWSLICAAMLIGYTLCTAAYTAVYSETMPGLTALTSERLTHYSTAQIENDNFVELQFDGNLLHIKRRANHVYTHPDALTIRTGYAVSLTQQAEWTTDSEQALPGYDMALDLTQLANTTHTLEVKSRQDMYTFVVLSLSFQKDENGCFLQNNTSSSKRYNYDALLQLQAGKAPNDFAALKTLYGKTEADKQTLSEMEALTHQLIAGCTNDRQKVRAVNRWILENISYDISISGSQYYTWIAQHPEDKIRLDHPLHAFREQYALCYGFSKLTVLMMGYAGIDCVYIAGQLASRSDIDINTEVQNPDHNSLNHAWNAVKVNGNWMFLDTSVDTLKNYYRTDPARPESGYTVKDRASAYLHQFPSLNYLSQQNLALCIGIQNPTVKLSPKTIPNGWQTDANGNRSFSVDGEKQRSIWAQIEGNIYRFGSSGTALKGWQLVDQYWRYFDSEGVMLIGTHELPEKDRTLAYTFDGEGCVTGDHMWIRFGDANRYYQGRNMAVGWQYVDGAWRYFDSKGALYQNPGKTLSIAGSTYAFDEHGALLIEQDGWLYFNQENHYFENGKPLTGVQQIDRQRYLFDHRGVMQTGLQSSGQSTYYLNDDGTMDDGWKFIGDCWYYFDPQQGMLTGSHKIGDRTYSFSAQGHLSGNGWVKIEDSWLYFDQSKPKKNGAAGGTLSKGWKYVDDYLRFFDPIDGKMYMGSGPLLNENNQKWYQFDEYGIATKR